MFKQTALTAIFTVAFTIIVNGQPLKNHTADSKTYLMWEESIGGKEAAQAIARLGDLSPATIRERLRQMRQPANLSNSELINKIIEGRQLLISTGEHTGHLKAVLKPVLAYHRREQMPIIVVYADQAKAMLVDRLAIIITTKMMAIASDTEIRGIVAHELAHEYIWDERKKARLTKDEKLMQECELFCDAVAAFTLKEIGDDPASYGRILERITLINFAASFAASNKSASLTAGSAIPREASTHPPLRARKKLNKFLCQRLN